jgi:amidase
MNRRTFLRSSVGSIAFGGVSAGACSRRPNQASPPARASNDSPFELEEATIHHLQGWMASGKYTSRALTDLYLTRIEATNRKGPELGAVIEINPDAGVIADRLDAERRAGQLRGRLHGIPILIKDNVDTSDRMLTTAGSLALTQSRPTRDAFVVERLRQAGAVILGKTNLIEFAGFKGMPLFSWSTRGGLCRNPYALDRSAIGSSCGSAVAASANLAAAAIGTETHGSIMAPCAFSGVVGIKPTVGLVSRAGIVPVAVSFDTAGPIARTITDAAILLEAIAAGDPRDPATAADHSFNLDESLAGGKLEGVRVGVAEAFLGDDRRVVQIIEHTVEAMKRKGAVIVRVPEAEIAPAHLDAVFPSWFVVMTSEFKDGLNRYLQARGPGSRMTSLKDVIAFNTRDPQELRFVDQQMLIKAEGAGSLTSDDYLKAATAVRTATRDKGLDRVIGAHQLHCVLGPTWPVPAPASDPIDGDSLPASGLLLSYAAMAGYPSVTLPVGSVFGLPVALCLVGPPWSESTLVKIALAIEQATHARKPPRFLATADLNGSSSSASA